MGAKKEASVEALIYQPNMFVEDKETGKLLVNPKFIHQNKKNGTGIYQMYSPEEIEDLFKREKGRYWDY